MPVGNNKGEATVVDALTGVVKKGADGALAAELLGDNKKELATVVSFAREPATAKELVWATLVG